MSFSILYKNIAKRLEQLESSVSKFEAGNNGSEQEWARARKDIHSVKRLLNNMGDISNRNKFDNRGNYVVQNNMDYRELDKKCSALLERFNNSEMKNIKQASNEKRANLLGDKGANVTHRQTAGTYPQDIVPDVSALREREEGVVNNVANCLDNYIDIGSKSLDELKFQRHTLERVRKKTKRAISNLRISDNLTRMIEKQYRNNKLVLFGGIAVTILLMFMIIKLLG